MDTQEWIVVSVILLVLALAAIGLGLYIFTKPPPKKLKNPPAGTAGESPSG
uniref:BVpp13a protein n=1 Tax=Chelonus inanitus TaxID=49201 RepID=D7FB48_9HYME|nr:BVpp13a protein [Chelonus inanitus]